MPAAQEKTVRCDRCEARCRIDPKPGSQATMLKRGKGSGLCVNCATHDFLRHTYPVNLQLAESGPRILLYPHVRELFANIMRAGNADAEPNEINWNLIVENWELPFPHKMKSGATNPVTEEEIERAKRDGAFGGSRRPLSDFDQGAPTTITSFEEINKIDPGLGDELRNLMHKSSGKSKDDDPPKQQKKLF